MSAQPTDLRSRLRAELVSLTTINRSDRRWPMPFAAALSSGLPLLVGAYFGHLDYGLISSLGGLLFLYLFDTPMHHRMVALLACAFAMIASYAAGVFSQLLANAGDDADKAARRIEKLFTAMQQRGGEYGDHDIAWFNGGLFKTIDIPPLTAADLTWKRPAHGISPRNFDEVLGMRARRDLAEDTVLSWADLDKA